MNKITKYFHNIYGNIFLLGDNMKKLLIIIILLLIIINLKTEKEEVRVRILANSNSEIDQKNKVIVKNILINNFKNYKYDDVDNFINSNLSLIENDLNNNIPNNLNITLKIEFLKTYFPAKSCNGKFVSSGYYKTLLITINEGKGNNWWSILYPEFFGIEYEDFGEIKCRSYIFDLFKKP